MEKKKSTKVECSMCKKGMSNPQIGIIIFAIYLLISSIYGTIQIVKDLFY
jgi:hypothetical protein